MNSPKMGSPSLQISKNPSFGKMKDSYTSLVSLNKIIQIQGLNETGKTQNASLSTSFSYKAGNERILS